MMNREHKAKIEEALLVAHRHRPELAVDHDWSRRVMHSVRSAQPVPVSTGIDAAVQQLVWRCGTLAGAVALAVLAYVAVSGGSPEQLVAGLLLDDGAVADLLQVVDL
jgi:hypothetical protein